VTGRGRYPHRDASIVVVIVGEHREDAFAGEEGWRAMRKFFGRLRHSEADAPDSAEMIFGSALRGFELHAWNTRSQRTPGNGPPTRSGWWPGEIGSPPVIQFSKNREAPASEHLSARAVSFNAARWNAVRDCFPTQVKHEVETPDMDVQILQGKIL